MTPSLMKAYFFTVFSVITVFPLAANAADFARLDTIGSARVSAPADMAIIHMTVQVSAPDAISAKSLSDDAVAKLMTRLQQNGITRVDIQSANLDLQPQYRFPEGKAAELTGYRASRAVSVTLRKLSRLDNVLNAGLNSGLNQVDQIEFTSSQMDKLKIQARAAAIADAQNKAAALAKGFGTKLGPVWHIRYLTRQPVAPVMYASRARNDVVAESYQPSHINVTDEVEVTYRLKP